MQMMKHRVKSVARLGDTLKTAENDYYDIIDF
jgi:hypothetical protein